MRHANLRTAVYRLFDHEGTLLYVGMSMNPKHRIATHPFRIDKSRTGIDWYENRELARVAEAAAITSENPIHNRSRPVAEEIGSILEPKDWRRRQIAVSHGSRVIWQEAVQAAREDKTSLADLTACALREFLARRRKRLGKLEISA
jgi:predicted GIY-YIG superfamily endonuclease